VPPRILLIFAHPDDESFATAGVVRRYANEGAEIALMTATRGQAGRQGDPPVCTVEELPAYRERELRAAAEILGIQHVDLLDYQDKQLTAADPPKIRRELIAGIRRHRPDLVMTFDPNGVNGHADHVAIARFAMDAAVAAADDRWHPDLGAGHHVKRVLWSPPVLPWDVPKSPDIGREPGVDFVVDISAYKDVKAAALRAHRSQHLSIDRCFFNNPDVDRILSVEIFRQGLGPALKHIPSDDVFEGLDV
jgi:LmbE family N-acetylglucosaminyl deacetylase